MNLSAKEIHSVFRDQAYLSNDLAFAPNDQNVSALKDKDILSILPELVRQERKHLTKILYHLREVERRKLFCDLECRSIFDYAVKELRYSEGQAGRRIQAMRLLNELPELQSKIESGALSLSNISQAQSYFREVNKARKSNQADMFCNAGTKSSNAINNSEGCNGSHENINERMIPKGLLKPLEKLKVLESLENKSAREGQRTLLKIQSQHGASSPLPRERERIISDTYVEICFVADKNLQGKIEEYRSLLGPKGSVMTFSELVTHLTTFGIENLKIKKFGKKRVLRESKNTSPPTSTPTLELLPKVKLNSPNTLKILKKKTHSKINLRYVSKELRHKIWQRDNGKCTNCESLLNPQFDHFHPLALGGNTTEENLRLLCHHCNQRAGIKMGIINTDNR